MAAVIALAAASFAHADLLAEAGWTRYCAAPGRAATVVPDPAHVVFGGMPAGAQPSASRCTVYATFDARPLLGAVGEHDAVLIHARVRANPDGSLPNFAFRVDVDVDVPGPPTTLFGYVASTAVDGYFDMRLQLPRDYAQAPLTLFVTSGSGAPLDVVGLTADVVAMIPPDRAVAAAVGRAMRIVRDRSIASRAPDEWTRIEALALATTAGLPLDAATYGGVLRNALRASGLPHSGVLVRDATNAPTRKPGDAAAICAAFPDVPMHFDASTRVLRVVLGAFSQPWYCVQGYVRVNAKRLERHIRRDRPVTIVVDLRGNQGGNMWPMLGALRSLLAGGPLLGFQQRDGSVRWVRFNGTTLLEGDAKVMEAGAAGARFDGQREAWICAGTTSSGEAVAIALAASGFKLAGQPSYGFASSNELIPVELDQVLQLTTARDTDREGRLLVGDRVLPSESRPELCN
ncbi:MAG: hypothetical protein JSR18_10800 [Proteobacteria bacterium]|nr:hypothetical protein [Pseudomonadota bacterium]